MDIKVGDLVSVRVKITSKTEEENGKVTYKVRSLTNEYQRMEVEADDITQVTMNVPNTKEE